MPNILEVAKKKSKLNAFHMGESKQKHVTSYHEA